MITVLQRECPWLRYAPCWVWFRLLMTSLLSLRVLAWQCCIVLREWVVLCRNWEVKLFHRSALQWRAFTDSLTVSEWVNEWMSELCLSAQSNDWLQQASCQSIAHCVHHQPVLLWSRDSHLSSLRWRYHSLTLE